MSNFILCPDCEGKGSIVNPNVDGNGITRDEMEELGPDFFEDYMSGVYDIICPRCKGLRVVDRYQELRAVRIQAQVYGEICHECSKKAVWGYSYRYSEYPGAYEWQEWLWFCIDHMSHEERKEYRQYGLVKPVVLTEEDEERLSA